MDANEQSRWRTVGSREVYVNPWIRVREDQVVRPDGKPGIYGVVEFPTYALGVVALTEDGDAILVGQWRYTLGRYSWELPEGGGDKTVAPLESIRRELREETGVGASDWIDLGSFDLSNSVTDETGRVFLARGLTFGAPSPDGDEALQVRFVPLEQVKQMCLDGRITDAVTIVGIFRACEHLASERG